MRVVAVIPAKGSSSRVPDKNFRHFYNEKSLLEIKIKQCKESSVFDAIYVSSDDERAKIIAENNEVNYVARDGRLCLDSTPWHEVLEGVLNSIPEADDVWVAWCPVTSPLFQRYKDIVDFLKKKVGEGFNSAVTVTPLKHYYLDSKFNPLNHRWGMWHTYSQSISPIYQLNLASIISIKNDMKMCKYLIGSNPSFFETQTWEGMDIDTMEEFEMAEILYSKYLSLPET